MRNILRFTHCLLLIFTCLYRYHCFFYFGVRRTIVLLDITFLHPFYGSVIFEVRGGATEEAGKDGWHKKLLSYFLMRFLWEGGNGFLGFIFSFSFSFLQRRHISLYELGRSFTFLYYLHFLMVYVFRLVFRPGRDL